MAKGEITPTFEEIPFDGIGESRDRMASNRFAGRLVARYGG